MLLYPSKGVMSIEKAEKLFTVDLLFAQQSYDTTLIGFQYFQFVRCWVLHPSNGWSSGVHWLKVLISVDWISHQITDPVQVVGGIMSSQLQGHNGYYAVHLRNCTFLKFYKAYLSPGSTKVICLNGKPKHFCLWNHQSFCGNSSVEYSIW